MRQVIDTMRHAAHAASGIGCPTPVILVLPTPMAYSSPCGSLRLRSSGLHCDDSSADETYRALQLALLLRPQQGRIIRGSGGLRKLRWRLPLHGRGKRGGLRLIYY